MPTLFIILLIILTSFAAANLVASAQKNCQVKRCKKHGPVIRFPFRLKDQPEHCSYPGFDLSCTQGKDTVLDLPFPQKSPINETEPPFTLKLLVKEIDYKSQLLYVSNPDGCFPELYRRLNLSVSPFPFQWTEDFAIFKCSSRKPSLFMHYVPCLSSSSYHVYAGPSKLNFYRVPISSCSKLFEIPSIPTALFDSQYPIRLRWPEPICELCKEEGKYCGLKNSSERHDVECFDPDRSAGPKGKLRVAGMLLGPILALAVAIGLYLIYRSEKLKKEDETKIEQFLKDYKALKPSRYSYADIKKITGNFSEKLGQGGYGTVYKGQLSNEVFVAAKELQNTKGDGEDFINEVGTIGTIHHVNVVRLVGYCADGFRRVLVYEFLPNQSLEKFISSDSKKNLVGWVKFEQIALGIARGVEYLHQGCDQRILHFDIKPHNILLDHNYNPKVSDFGQAKLCSKEQSAVSMTAARGTIGYIAPEVFSRNFGNVSCKSDVYSFGMLLLEMVGGRKKNTSGDEDKSEAYFPEWIFNKLEKGEEIVIQIENEDDSKIARKLTIVGLWCIQWCPADRPSMKKVIQMLEAEDCPPMPQNPYGSTNKRKNGSIMGRSLFNSELESISESE